jgi:hypothetical protein
MAIAKRKFPTWKTIKLNNNSEIELVKVSVAELGFNRPAYHTEIYEHAIKGCNLMLVSEEVGYLLLKQYVDQPFGERLLIGRRLSCDREGMLVTDCLTRDDNHPSELHDSCVEDHSYHLGATWVFARDKRKFIQAEEIASRIAVSTLKNSTTIVAHVVKVGDEYFEVLTPATGPYNEMAPTEVKKVDVKQVTLCPAMALAIEQARAKTK